MIPLALIFSLPIKVHSSNLNYEDAVRMKKNGTCPISLLSAGSETTDWSDFGFWREIKDFQGDYRRDESSDVFESQDFYSSVLGATEMTTLGDVDEEMATTRMLRSVGHQLGQGCKSALDQVKGKETDEYSDSSEFDLFDYEAVWESSWTEIASDWTMDFVIADAANGWRILHDRKFSNKQYSQFVSGWLERSSRWLQEVESRATELSTLGILPGMQYFGFLVATAQDTTNYLQCDSKEKSAKYGDVDSKDIYLQVAEKIIKSDFGIARDVIERDKRFCHDGREWKLDSKTGSLVMTADYTVPGVRRSINQRDSGIAMKLQLGLLLDEMFERAFNRNRLQKLAAEYSAALSAWWRWGRAHGESRPQMSRELRRLLDAGRIELSSEDYVRKSVKPGVQLCGMSGDNSQSPYRRWVIFTYLSYRSKVSQVCGC
jgi:hypothetical protein